ncbi:hypothetical protein C8J40_104422 [Sphingomonas sp. PP-CC-3A-396]|nr:hypothetical protein C8J40_104422 [Sphingomonas sp. PP-CC-3A-396]
MPHAFYYARRPARFLEKDGRAGIDVLAAEDLSSLKGGNVPNNALHITLTTRDVLRAVFPPNLWERVETTLMIDCGPAQVHSQDFDGEAMERIWLATLKLSDGSITAFENAVLLAQIDWRDVLLGAGFGNDLDAHIKWAAVIAA